MKIKTMMTKIQMEMMKYKSDKNINKYKNIKKYKNDEQDVESDDSDDSQSEESNLVDDDDDDDNDIAGFQKTGRGRQAGSWRNAVLRKEQNFFF